LADPAIAERTGEPTGAVHIELVRRQAISLRVSEYQAIAVEIKLRQRGRNESKQRRQKIIKFIDLTGWNSGNTVKADDIGAQHDQFVRDALYLEQAEVAARFPRDEFMGRLPKPVTARDMKLLRLLDLDRDGGWDDISTALLALCNGATISLRTL
jgi:hypothetical protein